MKNDFASPKKGFFRKGFQYIGQPLLWRMYRWYLSKPRWYEFEDLRVRLLPSVFHPGWLLSTKVLLSYVREFELKGKSILELGAGSGMISLCLAKAGAKVTASDINPSAIKAIQESCIENKVALNIIASDLFNKIPLQHFDFILVNPPYYPQNPSNKAEQAFFCGENFEYFQQFFSQVKPYLHPNTHLLMILSEDCELEKIKGLAKAEGMEMILVFQTRRQQEVQYIFKYLDINNDRV